MGHIVQLNNRVVLGPTLQAKVAAQAQHYYRLVLGTCMMGVGLGCARAMLFSTMLVPVQRACPFGQVYRAPQPIRG